MYIINLLKRQAQMYIDRLNSLLGVSNTKADVYKAHSTVLNDFYNHAFKPTLDNNQIREFSVEPTRDIIDSTKTDIDIAYEELDYISSKLQDAYNSNQDYKTSVKNRIQYLTSIASDLNIMSEQSSGQYIVFKDSLTNYDFIDREFSSGSSVNVSTSEGIAFLKITSDKAAAVEPADVKLSGNGTAGNYHVAKKVSVETISSEYDIYAKYQSEDDPHDVVSSIVDNQVQTWFEYEKVGFDDTHKVNRYNVEWATAEKMHDEVTLKVTIKFKEAQEINWIEIIPYLPERARSSVKVYSIKASLDGSEFSPIYKDRAIIDTEINLVPQRYLDGTLFNNSTLAKFASQGVFNFPAVKAQYLEVILKQDKPYDEFIGNTYYKEINMSSSGESSERIIPAEQVPAVILNGPVGKYQIETNKFVVKSIEVINGWRYCIGVRGFDVYDRRFDKQSELTTKKFTTNLPINKIILYTNEIIPDDYMNYGLEKRNDWIRYYISINDTDWYPISPMHHNQVGDLKIPPKIYEINSLASAEERISSINKGYLTAQGEVKNIRLKVVMTRPEDRPDSTPILEEYGLKCIFGGTA